ncbi:hypothetical protein PAMP_024594 [Pampus punctatissimus]
MAMETYTVIAEDLPEKTTMKTEGEVVDITQMFNSADIPWIVNVFREADADEGGGLDIEEFYVALKQLYGTVNKEDIIALHMQIDTNRDGTVDLGELLNFLLLKNKATTSFNLASHGFPKPINIVPVDHYKAIIKVIFRPFEDGSQPSADSDLSTAQPRTYQKGQYLSITSDGILNFWYDRFQNSYPIQLNTMEEKLPFSHRKKMCVNDMVYLSELNEMAIATSGRELLFYSCYEFPDLFQIKYSLIVEDNIVNTMNYWSDGSTAMFSFGDIKGFLSVFVSHDVKKNGLFDRNAFEEISLQDYPTVYVSSLFKNRSEAFLCIQVPIFNDVCHQLQYFSPINAFVVCDSSFTTMVVTNLQKSKKAKIRKMVFKSSKDNEYFKCVEYCHSGEFLVTGGTDGILRLWCPYDTTCCKMEVKGHVKSISHIARNFRNKVMISLSVDKNLRIWCEESWVCLQSIQIQGMGPVQISSLCYNVYNNELILANSNIGSLLGRGTDVFVEMLKSHDNPLCGALYHSVFKQVISVCQNGVVTVWDIQTGKSVMQFKVITDKNVRINAISFDGPKRRLITVSSDRKVNLWNFNNGAELGVHPVKVQKEVTGIVPINNRVFVSGRKSKIIFDLDIDMVDNRTLEHKYLNDISTMTAQGTTLFTASSSGNIVVWDTEAAEVLYWLDTTENPRTQMADKKTQGYVKNLIIESKQNKVRVKQSKTSTTLTKKRVNVNPILCMETRTPTADTATLLTAENDYIYAWSINSLGGLLGKFRAVLAGGAIITTMSTDTEETTLLIGDNIGNIYLWDIQKFGFRKKGELQEPSEIIKGWRVSLRPPPLLDSWRAHKEAVVSAKFAPHFGAIITASLDYNVSLWTTTGQHKGIFGKHDWDAMQRHTESAAIPGKPRMVFRTSPRQKPDMDEESLEIMELIKRSKQLLTKPPPPPPPSRPKPIESNEEMWKIFQQLNKIVPSINLIKDDKDLVYMMNKFKMESEQKSADEAQHEPENTTPPSPSRNSPTTDSTKSTNILQSASADRQGSEHTSRQPTPSQFKPHPPKIPLTTSRSVIKQSCPQGESPPYMNKTRLKYGRLLTTPINHVCKTDQVQHVPFQPTPDEVQLTNQTNHKPHPPQPLLTTDHRKGSEQQTKHVRLPRIPDKVQLTNQTNHKPHPPQPLLTTDQKKGSEQRTKHVRLPPIPDKIQLTNQTNHKPHPPQPLLTTDHRKGSEQQTKHVHLPAIQMKVQLTNQTKHKPHPPQPLLTTDQKKGSEQRTKHVRLPPIPDKIQLTNQTNHKPHPPQPLLTTDHRKGSEQQTKHVRLPPIPDKVQLTNQTNHKPHPPQPLLTTDQKKGSEQRTKHVRLPRIPDKIQLTNQTNHKPHPPQPQVQLINQTLNKPHPPQIPLTRSHATLSCPVLSD